MAVLCVILADKKKKGCEVSDPEFWKNKSLSEMNQEEWESLCDGCAKCCVIKLEDIDTGELAFTSVVCRLLDQSSCQCTDYKNRSTLVPDCIQITSKNAGNLGWMPETCAYRLLAEGQDLPDWHPLVSGELDSVHRAGMSVKDRVISEDEVGDRDIQDFIAPWPTYTKV